jgi:hypothetical protein
MLSNAHHDAAVDAVQLHVPLLLSSIKAVGASMACKHEKQSANTKDTSSVDQVSASSCTALSCVAALLPLPLYLCVRCAELKEQNS